MMPEARPAMKPRRVHGRAGELGALSDASVLRREPLAGAPGNPANVVTGDVFECGVPGPKCRLGKHYCLEFRSACEVLPDSCQDAAVPSCACFEGFPGSHEGGPGGWFCKDVSPGVFAAGIWP